MNKQLKNVPAGNKGLKKLPTAVRNKMGFMAKGGAVMKAKGGAVKMRGGGMASKGYSIGGAIDEINKKKTAKGMAKGGAVMNMRGGGMASKGGTKGGVAGGKKTAAKKTTTRKVAKKRDGIAKRGKTRA